MGASSPPFPRPLSEVHSQPSLVSQDAGGSDSRRDSLAGVVMPDGGLEASGGGP
jgi:hypothetical protein